ncbi:hypothetical protein SELMODRAFT_437711 [Selaginella moellendorffii]|uniref:Transcriptional corepressor SEUSS n=1 Tax=Selaginella moellendorffii TaxID=88036 RepID=D8QP20_SELML|nr:hypothetical protein SELMODRAFT_437711 [Selaginella moellendorffii]
MREREPGGLALDQYLENRRLAVPPPAASGIRPSPGGIPRGTPSSQFGILANLSNLSSSGGAFHSGSNPSPSSLNYALLGSSVDVLSPTSSSGNLGNNPSAAAATATTTTSSASLLRSSSSRLEHDPGLANFQPPMQLVSSAAQEQASGGAVVGGGGGGGGSGGGSGGGGGGGNNGTSTITTMQDHHQAAMAAGGVKLEPVEPQTHHLHQQMLQSQQHHQQQNSVLIPKVEQQQQQQQQQQQLHQQNQSFVASSSSSSNAPPPQHFLALQLKQVYEPGSCSRRVMQYIYHQRHRPQDNSITFWRRFIAEYFAPRAKKRWCVSLYGNGNNGRQPTGVFPQDVWQCEICGTKPGRGFETTVEVLPRLCKIKYDSGILEELLFVDMPHEYRLASGVIVLEYGKAIQESIFDQLRVVRDGQLRIIFSPDLKIHSWEFCARSHEELLPRRMIVPQVTQLATVAQKYQQSVAQTGTAGLSSQDLQTNCSMFVTSSRNLARNLEVPTVNDLGYTKRYVRCLQISEVVNSMKDLIDFSRENSMGPKEHDHQHQLMSSSTIAPPRQQHNHQQQQHHAHQHQHQYQLQHQQQQLGTSLQGLLGSFPSLLHQHQQQQQQSNSATISPASSLIIPKNTTTTANNNSFQAAQILTSSSNLQSPTSSGNLMSSPPAIMGSNSASMLQQQPSSQQHQQQDSVVHQLLQEMMMNAGSSGMISPGNSLSHGVGNVNGFGASVLESTSNLGMGMRSTQQQKSLYMSSSQDHSGGVHDLAENGILSSLGAANGFASLPFDWKSP